MLSHSVGVDLSANDMLPNITTRRVRTWATLGMTFLLITSLLVWMLQRETVPRQIRIATGSQQGLYFKVGSTIGAALEERIGSKIDIKRTDGSKDNFQLLKAGQVDLAIVQGGSVPIEEASVITPLFREFVFVVVRKGTNIQSVWELSGRKVCLGQKGSGNRDAALKVLQHFGIDQNDIAGNNDLPLEDLLGDSSIEAAIVTAGIEHPLLRKLLSTHQFEILPIRSAVAMELVHPFVRNVEIPRGLFAEHPPVPAESIPTIATTAYLVSGNDAPSDLVQAALEAIHEESLKLEVPTLIARRDAPQLTVTRLHPTAQRYFNPEDNIGEIVTVMESLIAMKELLFAIGAGVYLMWIRWLRLKEKEHRQVVDRQKEHLDRLLTETLRIEKTQLTTCDPNRLSGLLKEVTQIKLQALQELTDEELRGNQSFSILLDQCSSLISKIQLELVLAQSSSKQLPQAYSANVRDN